MCGRYAFCRSDVALLQELTVSEAVGQEPPPSLNVARTQPVRAVLDRAPRDHPDGEPVQQLRIVRWGLVPSWAKDVTTGNRLIDGRVESITQKPAVKAAAARQRRLIPADGYYEWEKRAGQQTKVPYFLHDADGQTLAFAGLYELWPDPAREHDDPDRWLWSAVILTTQATDELGHIDDRSPVLLPPDLRERWLDPATTDPDDIHNLLDTLPEPRLLPIEVSTAVNNVRTNGPELIEAVD